MEEFEYKAVRSRLHEHITEVITDEHESVTGVTGWILIIETAVGQTRRALNVVAGDVFGERDIPTWTAKGWLDEVSENVDYYIGPDQDDDEEEDD